MIKKVIFYISIFLISSCSLKNESQKLDYDIAIYTDNIGTIDIHQIDKISFKKIDSKITNYKLGLPALWVKITNKNLPKLNLKTLLRVGNVLTDSITLYQKKGTIYSKNYRGLLIKKSDILYKSHKPIFAISLKKNETIYIKIKSRIALEIPILLEYEKDFIVINNLEFLFQGFLYGIVFILLFYNLLVFYFTKKTIHLLYVLGAFFTLLVQSFLLGHIQYFVLSEHPKSSYYLFYIALFLGTFFITLLCDYALELKEKEKKLHKLTSLIALISLCCIVLLFILNYYIMSIITLIVVSLFSFGILFICLKLSLKKNKIAQLLSVTWFVYIFGTIANFLRTLDIISTNWFTANITFSSFFAEFLMMAILLHYMHYLNSKEEKLKQKLFTNKLNKEVTQKTQQLTLALSQKNELLSEVHHRVKNNLQVIFSLFNLQERRVKNTETKKALEAGKNRVKSMSLLHEHLYKNNSFKQINSTDYMTDLVNYLSNLYKRNIDVQLNIESVLIPNDFAIPIGLITTEVLSNSYKYAFPSDEKNQQITVQFYKKAANYHLIITDNGIGFDASIKTTSLGTQLIKGMCHQLNGTFSLQATNGTSYTFTFPITK